MKEGVEAPNSAASADRKLRFPAAEQQQRSAAMFR